MLFYELDIRVWDYHQEWTFEEFHTEVVGKKNVEKKLDVSILYFFVYSKKSN